MPSVRVVAEQCRWLVDHGRGDEAAHLVLPGVENRKRIKKPPKRFSLGGDEDFVRRLLIQKERYMTTLPKHIALELLCKLWETPTTEQLERWGSGEQSNVSSTSAQEG